MHETTRKAVERVLALLAMRLETEPATAAPNSVEVTRDSKGEKVTVKAYAATVEEAGRLARAEYDRPSGRYGGAA